jgi:hypothetical protein
MFYTNSVTEENPAIEGERVKKRRSAAIAALAIAAIASACDAPRLNNPHRETLAQLEATEEDFVPQTLSATDILAGSSYWGADRNIYSGSMIARGTLDASVAFAGDGYYSGSLTGLPAQDKVCSGTSILGIAGSAECGVDIALPSTQHRELGSIQMRVLDETVIQSGAAYNAAGLGNRAVPQIAKDDESSSGANITPVNRTGWGATPCGTSGTTAQRIADCVTVFGANATWNGETNGHAGEGTWKLVARTGAVTGSKGREVWQDQRTLLLWSSRVGSFLNWCKASGSNNIAGNPAAEDDPSDHCDNAANQATAGQAVSACFEDDGTHFTQADADVDSAGKAGLGLASTPAVAWRLPSLWDYNLAWVNGLSAVMPDMSQTGLAWSATVRSTARQNAFATNGGGDNLASARNNTAIVRCVGR